MGTCGSKDDGIDTPQQGGERISIKDSTTAGNTVSLPAGATITPFVPGPPLAVRASSACVFGKEAIKCKLIAKTYASVDTRLFTFELPDPEKALNLPTCASILAQAKPSGSKHMVTRAFSPVSTNACLGTFDLLVKVYKGGLMSQHMDSLVPGEGEVYFKHLPYNVKIQYPFGKKKIGMICGGTGVAPMIQALNMLLGTTDDETVVSMLYGSRTADSILGKECLEQWAGDHSSRFSVTHVLSREPNPNEGVRGHIGRELVEKHMPKPGEGGIIFVCGPPAMYETICGPRHNKVVSGLLKDMGYSNEEVYKF